MFLSALGFSLAINLLGLTSSIYMLQIYDRVLSSYSIETLIVLSLMAAGAYAALAGLEALRTYILQRTGARIASRLSIDAFHIQLNASAALEAPTLQPLRDVEALKNLIGGPTVAALMDLPWSPIYFILLYMLSPVLFLITLVAGALLALTAFLNNHLNHEASGTAAKSQLKALQFAETAARSGETIMAMGGTSTIGRHWMFQSTAATKQSLSSAERETGFLSIAKFLKNGLQTALLGAGAALTIFGQLSSGGIIAGSILGTRAMAPIEAVIGAWRSVMAARQACNRLDYALATLPPKSGNMELPKPRGEMSCENVTIFPPGFQRPILSNVSFLLPAGETMVVVGPSGSGKSTLTRALIGITPFNAGSIRIDGSDVIAWQKADLGRWIGYLPQSPTLLAGTIAQNICHFCDAEPSRIIEAAQTAAAHDMILRLPKGYDTDVGPGGVRLSGGQTQRIAIARALFDQRPIIVLDEPESHLDTEGENQLRSLALQLKKTGTTIIIVSHRSSAISIADKLLIVRDGRCEFGPREDILNGIMRTSSTTPVPVAVKAHAATTDVSRQSAT